MSPLVKKYLCRRLVRFLLPIPPWIPEAFGERVSVNLQFCNLAQEREQAEIRVCNSQKAWKKAGLGIASP